MCGKGNKCEPSKTQSQTTLKVQMVHGRREAGDVEATRSAKTPPTNPRSKNFVPKNRVS